MSAPVGHREGATLRRRRSIHDGQHREIVRRPRWSTLTASGSTNAPHRSQRTFRSGAAAVGFLGCGSATYRALGRSRAAHRSCRRKPIRCLTSGVRQRQLCKRCRERRGVDRAHGLTCRQVGQRTRAKAIGWSRVAVVVERYEAGESLLVPPAHGVEVDRRQRAVQEDGFTGIHLAQRVRRARTPRAGRSARRFAGLGAHHRRATGCHATSSIE